MRILVSKKKIKYVLHIPIIVRWCFLFFFKYLFFGESRNDLHSLYYSKFYFILFYLIKYFIFQIKSAILPNKFVIKSEVV